MWSGPRNISTAMMYSFAQRSDTRVVDEPLYGHYLSHTETVHPGAEAVKAAMICDGQRVVREVILGPTDRPVLFLKNMPHHLIHLDWAFIGQLTNFLLLRHPREMLPSLDQKIAPTLRDTGYDVQLRLLNHLRTVGQEPPVIDSKDVLLDPHAVLSRLCERLGIPFDEAMLRWEAGSRPEDGVWAKYWYHSVHKSTGFAPYIPKTDPFPDHLLPLLDECLPYYEQLVTHAIRA